jgi:hypothetical protein
VILSRIQGFSRGDLPSNQRRKILATRELLRFRIDIRSLPRFEERAVPLHQAFVVGEPVG